MKKHILVILSIFALGIFTVGAVDSQSAQHANSKASVYYVRVRAAYEGPAEHKAAIITQKAIKECAKTFKGRPVLLGHNQRDPNAVVGYIITARYRYDDNIKKHIVEAVFKIVDTDAISRIKDGRYKFVSIGIDFEPQDVEYILKDQLRWRKINKFVGLEISFVAVPAMRHAQILERSNLLIKLK